MAGTINPPIGIASGSADTWDFKVEAGRTYIVSCKGTYSGSTISIQFENQAVDPRVFDPIDDTTMDGTTKTGVRLTAPTGTLRLASSGAIGGVRVTVTPAFSPDQR